MWRYGSFTWEVDKDLGVNAEKDSNPSTFCHELQEDNFCNIGRYMSLRRKHLWRYGSFIRKADNALGVNVTNIQVLADLF